MTRSFAWVACPLLAFSFSFGCGSSSSNQPADGADASDDPGGGTVAGAGTGGANSIGDAGTVPSGGTPNGGTPSGGAEPADASMSSDPGPDGGVSCDPVSELETSCDDDQDDDCDGLVDCRDDDCGRASDCAACVPASADEAVCDDGDDDDCDGFADCDDIDCGAASSCQNGCVPTTEQCTDANDNDCDGFTDCADSDCAPTAACCAPTGSEVCDDGIDNNCDGVIDCPIILTTVPSLPPVSRSIWEGGATSADKATLVLETPASANYVVQCRSAKPGDVSAEPFVVCNSAEPSALDVKPFPVSEAENSALDGLTSTQVRFAYPNGQVSQPSSFTYYVHSSLAGVDECPERASDQDYFDAAATTLVADPADLFDDADARLAAPFVNVDFAPPANVTFDVGSGEGAAEYLSLRRRFVLNADKTMVLMKRVFESRRAAAGNCLAVTARKHDSDLGPDGSFDKTRYFRTGCHAMVLNKQGAGVCLVVDDADNISVANPTSSQWQYWNFDIFGWVNWVQADNFMWRKLQQVESAGTRRVHFSPKCYSGGSACTDGDEDVLFLPDRNLFSW